MNNPAKGTGIRIIESGEMRVVNAASKQHWDFARDNVVQLKQHINDLRFQNGQNQANGNSLKNTSTTILVKLGLSKINTPSLELLPKQEAAMERSHGVAFEHSLREGAPRNKLSQNDNGNTQRVVSHFKTEDQNFGAKNSLNVVKHSPQLFDQSVLQSRGNSVAIPAGSRSMNVNFGHDRRASGQIFESKNRASQDVIFSNFLQSKLSNSGVNPRMKQNLSKASIELSQKSLRPRDMVNLPGASSKSFLARSHNQSVSHVSQKSIQDSIRNDSKSQLATSQRGRGGSVNVSMT